MNTFVLAGDASYTAPIETIIKSILYHHHTVKICVMHQNISQEWMSQIKKFAFSLGSVIEEVRLLDDSVRDEWITLEHISPIGFARYWIPECIREERVVYLDCDMVVHQPLDELFSMDLQGYPLAAIRDANGQGFNSGMMVIDNEQWRQKKVMGQLIQKTIEESTKDEALTGDQEILNDVFQQEWLELPQYYNLQVGHDPFAFYGHWTDHFKNREIPRIVHYTTANKPWNSVVGYRYRDLWFEYQKLTHEDIQAHYDGNFEVKRIYEYYDNNVFTFTDSQDFLYAEELVQALPNVAFHIAAWTNMGDYLLSLQRFPNVYLYPQIVGAVIDELVEYSDAYLDHHYGSSQEEMIRRFSDQHKSVFAFDRTSKNPDIDTVVSSETVELMVEAIKQLSEPLISVIVPIYNMEAYVEECILSILNQTYNNLELILVDDGSTDNSRDICQRYVEQDSRVMYFYKENSGVADARNLGLDKANGEFLFFVDPDDWIERDCLESLLRVQKKYRVDFVKANYTRYHEDDGMFHVHIFEDQYYEQLLSRKEILETLPEREVYDISFLSCCFTLIHRRLFNQLIFPSGRMQEDMGTVYKLILQTENIVYVNKPVYYYRIRQNSTTTQRLTAKQMQDDMELRMERIAILALAGYDMTQYRHHQCFYFVDWVNGVKDDDTLNHTEIFRRFHENAFLLNQN